jgi:hypothetical protein
VARPAQRADGAIGIAVNGQNASFSGIAGAIGMLPSPAKSGRYLFNG